MHAHAEEERRQPEEFSKQVEALNLSILPAELFLTWLSVSGSVLVLTLPGCPIPQSLHCSPLRRSGEGTLCEQICQLRLRWHKSDLN